MNNTPILNQLTASKLTNEEKLYMLKNTNKFSQDISLSITRLSSQWKQELNLSEMPKSDTLKLRQEFLDEAKAKGFDEFEYKSIYDTIIFKLTGSIESDNEPSIINIFNELTKAWLKFVNKVDVDLQRFTSLKVIDILNHILKAYEIREKLEDSTGLDTGYKISYTLDMMKSALVISNANLYIFSVFMLLRYIQIDHLIVIPLFNGFAVANKIDSEYFLDVIGNLLLHRPDNTDIIDIFDKIEDIKDIDNYLDNIKSIFTSINNSINSSCNEDNDDEYITTDIMYQNYCIHGRINSLPLKELVLRIRTTDEDDVREYIGNREPIFDIPTPTLTALQNYVKDYPDISLAVFKAVNSKDNRVLYEYNDKVFMLFTLFESASCIFGISLEPLYEEDKSILRIQLPSTSNNYKLKAGDNIWQ